MAYRVQRVVHEMGVASEGAHDQGGRKPYAHERLRKARHSLNKLVNQGTLFTFAGMQQERSGAWPSTNNAVESVNARLREMLRLHRGLPLMHRIKAIFWWCYMPSPEDNGIAPPQARPAEPGSAPARARGAVRRNPAGRPPRRPSPLFLLEKQGTAPRGAVRLAGKTATHRRAFG